MGWYGRGAIDVMVWEWCYRCRGIGVAMKMGWYESGAVDVVVWEWCS